MKTIKIIKFLPILLLLFACNAPEEVSPTDVPILPTATSPINTPVVTPTEVIGYVALVNGEGISEAVFLADMRQFEEALENGYAHLEDGQIARDIVIEDIIHRVLLSQAAREAEFFADTDRIKERISQLENSLGGPEVLSTWILEQGYTPESFEEALGLEIEAAWQRSQIFNALPTVAEQVLARQLFFYNLFQAEAAYALLEKGNSFEDVVREYDPENLGYLGWFPRNYLLLLEIENLAFSLQLGEYSGIVETEFGYHILELLDHDPAKALSADVLLHLQEEALFNWLEERWAQSQIEILKP